MHSNKILGYRMDLLYLVEILCLFYYLISKLFSSKSSSRTEKHFILDFKNKQIFGKHRATRFFSSFSEGRI